MSDPTRTTDTGSVTGTPAPEPTKADIESLVSQEFDKAEKDADTAGKAGDDPARKEPGKAEPKKEDPQPPKLYAGKYKTVEEMEAAYEEAQRKMHEISEAESKRKREEEARKDEGDFVELNRAELEELQKNDPEAYEEYVFEALKRKREAKAKAREEDDKRVEEIVDKRLKPFDETRREIELRKWEAEEDNIFSTTKTEFGQEFQKLEEQRKDSKFLGTVLSAVPEVARVILGLNSGKDPLTGERCELSPARAHKMLLREIQNHNLRTMAEKSRRSIPPDAGTATPPKAGKEKVGSSIEEAFDLSFAELNSK